MSNKHNNKSRLVFLVLTSLSMLAGCAMAKGYRGDHLPKSELSTVRGFGVTIHQVNDVEVGATASGIRIPSGPNKIYFSINSSNYNSPENTLELKELSVDLAPEVEYAVTSQRGDARVCAWPLSTTTGAPVFKNPAGCL